MDGQHEVAQNLPEVYRGSPPKREQKAGSHGGRQPTYYERLGVERGATAEELSRARKELLREFHPDTNPDPDAEETFKEIGEAYRMLSDPRKREIYDLQLDAGLDPSEVDNREGKRSSRLDSLQPWLKNPVREVKHLLYMRKYNKEKAAQVQEKQSYNNEWEKFRGQEFDEDNEEAFLVAHAIKQATPGSDIPWAIGLAKDPKIFWKKNLVFTTEDGKEISVGHQEPTVDTKRLLGNGPWKEFFPQNSFGLFVNDNGKFEDVPIRDPQGIQDKLGADNIFNAAGAILYELAKEQNNLSPFTLQKASDLGIGTFVTESHKSESGEQRMGVLILATGDKMVRFESSTIRGFGDARALLKLLEDQSVQKYMDNISDQAVVIRLNGGIDSGNTVDIISGKGKNKKVESVSIKQD